MKNLLLSLCGLFFLAALWPFHARSADVYMEGNRLVIDGEIRRGDAERVVQTAVEHVSTSKRWIMTFMINSPGGDILESLRIADLVSALKPSVYVSRGGKCASACFFVFLEAYERVGSSVADDGSLPLAERRAKRFGLVGIHRPYLKSPTGDIESAIKQEELMRRMRAILTTKHVPQYLIDEMMARPSNEIYWLRDRDLEAIGPFNPGDEEALISKCGFKRTAQVVDEQWSELRKDKVDECTFNYWASQYSEQQLRSISKLRTAWRPWSAK